MTAIIKQHLHLLLIYHNRNNLGGNQHQSISMVQGEPYFLHSHNNLLMNTGITPHCNFTRLNPKRISPFQFCLPALLGIHSNPKQKDLEIIQFILSDKHLDGACRSLGHFLDKVRKWHFHSTSNKVIQPKNFSNSMHGSKSAILAIFQTGPEWPCTVSAAFKNPSRNFKNSFCIGCR